VIGQRLLFGDDEVEAWVRIQLLAPWGRYAGIGSREVPERIAALMTKAAEWLAECGWTLRSGAASGSDTAFEVGVPEWGGVELYLPFPTFGLDPAQARGPITPLRRSRIRLRRPTDTAYEIAAQYHPRWARLPVTARALHARNSHQVLGPFLDEPVEFVLCWTPDGADGVKRKTSAATGGTGQAIRIAAGYGIPVMNLGDARVCEAVEKVVGFW